MNTKCVKLYGIKICAHIIETCTI